MLLGQWKLYGGWVTSNCCYLQRPPTCRQKKNKTICRYYISILTWQISKVFSKSVQPQRTSSLVQCLARRIISRCPKQFKFVDVLKPKLCFFPGELFYMSSCLCHGEQTVSPRHKQHHVGKFDPLDHPDGDGVGLHVVDGDDGDSMLSAQVLCVARAHAEMLNRVNDGNYVANNL